MMLLPDCFLQTGGFQAVNIQVFGDESRSDRVHLRSMSKKHSDGFIAELLKVKNFSES